MIKLYCGNTTAYFICFESALVLIILAKYLNIVTLWVLVRLILVNIDPELAHLPDKNRRALIKHLSKMN